MYRTSPDMISKFIKPVPSGEDISILKEKCKYAKLPNGLELRDNIIKMRDIKVSEINVYTLKDD